MVVRAQHGDHRAFDCLVRTFQGAAVTYARTLLNDSAAAEDAAQDAFVRAWCDLPRLANPAAFGGWLRRIVFKHCDRIRRSARITLQLSDDVPASPEDEPFSRLERAGESLQVHTALNALPDSVRETTLLYYETGMSVSEIAAFLGLSPTAVKNRLYSARKRLRKELWEMGAVNSVKPVDSEEFAAAVLARVLREFQNQESNDRHKVDRGLLDQAGNALFKLVRTGEDLSVEAVRNGYTVLSRKVDFTGLSALLMRYLRQPLSASEEAWAYLKLAGALAESGSSAGAVLAHEAFERSLVGKTPRLSWYSPHFPVSEESSERRYKGDDVRLLFLCQSWEFATSYLRIWRSSEYLAKVDIALAEIAPTRENYDLRFFVRRMVTCVCEELHDYNRAQQYIRQMHVLADEGETEEDRAETRLKALGHEMKHAQLQNDDAHFISCVEKASDLLDGFSNEKYKEQGVEVPAWVRGQRHDLAHLLEHAGRHALALPLLEANLACGGQFGGWGWLMHAAAVWQVTHKRERTLALLREARAHDDRDIAEMFAERAEFVDVWDDVEFLEAVCR